jgi:hypothetical protein
MNMPTANFIAATVAVLSLPALAMADRPASKSHKPTPSHKPTSSHVSTPSGGNSANSPSAQCRAERTAMGEANFKSTYGTNANKSNAFGKCVSKTVRAGG